MLYIGHKNPDTDSICAAIAAADLFGGEAGMTSTKLSPESAFVLDKFGFESPSYIENLKDKEVVLVDFNQKSVESCSTSSYKECHNDISQQTHKAWP